MGVRTHRPPCLPTLVSLEDQIFLTKRGNKGPQLSPVQFAFSVVELFIRGGGDLRLVFLVRYGLLDVHSYDASQDDVETESYDVMDD